MAGNNIILNIVLLFNYVVYVCMLCSVPDVIFFLLFYMNTYALLGNQVSAVGVSVVK